MRPFWDPRGSRSDLLLVLDPHNRDSEGTTEQAWRDVIRHTHPQTDVINGRSVGWLFGHAVLPRADELDPPGGDELDSPGADELDPPGPRPVVMRRVQMGPDTQEGSPDYQRFNWIIVEYAPPSHDTPEGWKELLLRACARQEKFDRGTHDIFMICAVGVKYMIFSWDPRNAGNPTQELCIHIAGEDTHFPSQLKPAPEASPHLPNLNASGHPDQYRINLDRVWSLDPGQTDDQGRPMEPLTAMDRFMRHTRTAQLENPYRAYN